MEDKELLITLGKKITSSGLRKTTKFKSLITKLTYTDISEICEELILLCLQYDINCQFLINALSEYKHSEISEDELRKRVLTALTR